jgi:adenosylcobinamide kinase/adenosylcobinamide-phosphate guanylyltransferase
MSNRHVTLVIGGCRSGKSRHALELAQGHPARRRVYLATCVPRDAEMHERVRRHQVERGAGWITREEPLDLVGVLAGEARPDQVLLVDCLTLWVSNLLLESENEEAVTQASAALVTALGMAQGPVILVSNEVGLGIVPDNRLARLFRDCAGQVNQAVAACAGTVVWSVAGIPVVIKGAL